MADKDSREPSLELPSLAFRRRRSTKQPAESAPAPAESAPVPAESAPVRGESAPVPAETVPPRRSASAAAPGPARSRAVVDDNGQTGEALPASEQHTALSSHRRFSLPDIGGLPAALVTGALVGILTVGLTWACFRLCEVLQGTSSCGDPGFLLLLAIMVAMVVLGSALLRAWTVPDPGSTSLLAVGLLAVVALLFLIDALFSGWMILVIPAVCMATFALAHWITTAVAEPAAN